MPSDELTPPGGYETDSLTPPGGYETKKAAESPPMSMSDVVGKAGEVVGGAAKLGVTAVMHPGQTLAAPFEAAGEAIRTGVGTAIDLATGQPNSPDNRFRPPTLFQTAGIADKTNKPPADPIVMAESGFAGLMKGSSNLMGKALGYKEPDTMGAMTSEIKRAQENPNLLDIAGQMAFAMGTGSVGNAPIEALVQGIRLPLAKAVDSFGPSVVKKMPDLMARFGINKTASNIIVKDPDLLKDPNLGTRTAIESVSDDAKKTIDSYLKKQNNQIGQSVLMSQKKAITGVDKLRAGLENEVEKAGGDIQLSRGEAGVAISDEQKRQFVLHPALPLPRAKPVTKLAETINGLDSLLTSNSSMFDTKDWMKRIFDIKTQVESKILKGNANEVEAAALNSYGEKIKGLISKVPGSASEKYRALKFYKEKSISDQLTRKFNTPNGNPTIQELTRQAEFLKKHAENLNPKEQASAILATRMAIDEFEVSYAKTGGVDTRTSEFIKNIRNELSGAMKGLPGFENVNKADTTYHTAMVMAQRLDKSLQGPKSFEKFLKDIYSDVGGKKSNEDLAALYSLEEKLGMKGLSDSLYREFQIRDEVLKTKIPFDSEFSSKAESEKFMRGLFNTAESDPIAREKIEKLRKIPGMGPVLDDSFKHLSVELFREKPVLSNWEKRFAIGEVMGLALFPFSHRIGLGAAAMGFSASMAMRTRYPTFWASVIKSGKALAEASKMTQPLGAASRASLLLGSRYGESKEQNQ